jgi:hypothetical protein
MGEKQQLRLVKATGVTVVLESTSEDYNPLIQIVQFTLDLKI